MSASALGLGVLGRSFLKEEEEGGGGEQEGSVFAIEEESEESEEGRSVLMSFAGSREFAPGEKEVSKGAGSEVDKISSGIELLLLLGFGKEESSVQNRSWLSSLGSGGEFGIQISDSGAYSSGVGVGITGWNAKARKRK